MKLRDLLNKNRNRLGVFTYAKDIKRHFYLSVKWQQNVTGLSASNRDDVSDVHYYALAFPVDVVVVVPSKKNKYFVMQFIQKNILNRAIPFQWLQFPWRWEGQEKVLASARQVHVFILHLEILSLLPSME